MPLLRVANVTLKFGGLTAIRDLSFHVDAGEIVSLIGPNGAGKTSVFNCITGFYRPVSGEIEFDGRSVLGLRPHRRTVLGMARTFQNLRLFPNLTALENVMAGTHCRTSAGLFASMLRLPSQRAEERRVRELALHWLEFVGLKDQAHRLAKNLPYGAQRRLEIARAMASQPKLLLLDEPAAGLNPAEKESLMELIHKICGSGVTPLLIEHDMGLVMRISSRLVVLDHGEKIAEGDPESVRDNPLVIEAYLGREEEEGA
ncbi:branched-chain amino acid transport system ATP-binding protein [Symbiobacterium terraclitae]|uniref:Branched-chain amino acid transport system ATP-binding protein n=1 Tax=Symbiobacterium terraclitae TaxID=557451 RepID=A0ABS4JPL6_9FIRM|nr:ABC transporter ATP-binding protein [Symbiobacterium terraclitae]MBP2017483.1 branched-chain amino acid transport system ATP-binding protein [Symbiobacterium terraclitae]